MNGHLLLVLPVVVPLATLALCTLLWRRPLAQRLASVAGSAALLAAALALLVAVYDGTVLATHFGAWASPFGISFVADLLSAAMVLITAVMAVAVSVYALVDEVRERERAFFHPLFHGLLLGVCGAFLTADIFNLYVWFETMLIASFGLLVVGGTRAQLDAGVKYVTLNLVATTLFLVSVGFLYGLTGTLNMADLARVLPRVENQGLVTTLAVMFLLAFGSKAALFPVFYWLPAAYHTASAPIVAIFAALLTKVGVYALLRSFTLMFTGDAGYTGPIIGAVAAMTMITGVLGAAAHFDIRRILSFHIISQIGYMAAGLSLAFGAPSEARFALAAAIFYIVHHILVKTTLFLVAGIVRRTHGSSSLDELGGVARTHRYCAALFLISALSLAGTPPLSGFWAKLAIIQAGLSHGAIALVVVAVITGLLTLLSMIKIWYGVFLGEPRGQPVPQPSRKQLGAMYAGATLLVTCTLVISIAPGTLFSLAFGAADQLLAAGGLP